MSHFAAVTEDGNRVRQLSFGEVKVLNILHE